MGCVIEVEQVSELSSMVFNLYFTSYQLCDLGQMTLSYWSRFSLSYGINNSFLEVPWRLNGVKHIKCLSQYVCWTKCAINLILPASLPEMVRTSSNLGCGLDGWSLSNFSTLRFCDRKVTNRSGALRRRPLSLLALLKSSHGREIKSSDLLALSIFQVLMGCSHLCDNNEEWLLIF